MRLSTYLRFGAAALACLAGWWASSSVAGADLTGYEALSDWASLPLVKTGVTAGLASSYDRAGGNDDFSQYESPSGLLMGPENAVIRTLTGPGVITRVWMPHATSDLGYAIKITVDGRVVIDTTSNAFLGGTYGYASSPLVGTLVGGQTSYEPIAFSQSAVIQTTNRWNNRDYYQYDYHLLGAGQTITPYTGALTSAQQAARAAAVGIVNNAGANPNPTPGVLVSTAGSSIPAGGSAALANVTGGGMIEALKLKMAGASDAQLDGLRLRVRYDGQTAYAVDVPVSQFYGVGHQRAAYQSVPMGNDPATGFYSYWPMPYRKGATVELYNSTAAAIPIDSAAVQYDPTWAVPLDVGYFHAAYSQETTVAGQAYHQLLNVSGQGHYVGNLLYLQSAGTNPTRLEGDDIVTVNPGKAGETVLYGTGLEDAYNGGYYYNHVGILPSGEPASPQSGTGPYAGLLNMNFYTSPGFEADPVTRADQYRWLIGDYVPYTDGLNVKMENFGSSAGIGFASTAFYYDVPVRLPGDANRDGQVGPEDFGILKDTFGLSVGVTWEMGDFNGDGQVGPEDFGLLKDNFGRSTTTPLVNVPEPCTLLLLAVGAFGAGFRRRSR